MHPYLVILGREIPTYGICIFLGIAIAALLAKFAPAWKKRDYDYFILISACVLGMGFLGARVAYVLVSYPLASFFSAFLELLSAKGGLVFYGGFIGGAIGYWIGLKIAGRDVSSKDYIDIYAVLIPLIHGFGRIGCFFGGCCHGGKYEGFAAIPWRWVVDGKAEDVSYFPVQLVEAITLFCLAIFMYQFMKRRHWFGKFTIRPIVLYMGVYAIDRFALEFLRGDAIRGQVMGVSTSQFISICMMLLVVVYIGWWKCFGKKKFTQGDQSEKSCS